jgi:hypothetical protein
MSPGNRRNPDHTSILGRFAWDTLVGFYAVGADKPGCKAPHGHGKRVTTRIFPVPPPVSNLVLTLACPKLRRAASTIHLVVRRTGPRQRQFQTVFLQATVRSRQGGRPQGAVSFIYRHRVLAQVAVDPRTGNALLDVTLPSHSAVAASYGGDARFAPSRTRAH